MSETQYDSLARLRAANPFRVPADLGHSAAAQATLRGIMTEPAVAAERRRRRGWRSRAPRGGLGVVLAAVVIGGGAAFAATDPFGWISTSPDTAKYEVNPAIRVTVPYIDQIACHPGRGSTLTCSPRGSGRRYELADTVRPAAPASLFSRAGFTAAIARAQATRQLSTAAAAKIRHDLARVPDSFFVELRLGMRYQTIAGGPANGRVPPIGVPEWVVCEGTRSVLTCQNLNGDQHVPVGARIYMAEYAPDWRRAPRIGPDRRLPPGITFTPSEYPLLFDIVRYARATGGGSHGGRVVARPVGRR